jgi:hypothetical protein
MVRSTYYCPSSEEMLRSSIDHMIEERAVDPAIYDASEFWLDDLLRAIVSLEEMTGETYPLDWIS